MAEEKKTIKKTTTKKKVELKQNTDYYALENSFRIAGTLGKCQVVNIEKKGKERCKCNYNGRVIYIDNNLIF